MLYSLVAIRGIQDPSALMLLLLIGPGEKLCLAGRLPYFSRVLLHMRNCKASGTLIFLLWHFVSIWPMICPGRNCFAELLVD